VSGYRYVVTNNQDLHERALLLINRGELLLLLLLSPRPTDDIERLCNGDGCGNGYLRPALAGGSLPSLVSNRKEKYTIFFGVQLVTSSLSLLNSINTHLITLVPDSCSFQIDNTLSRPA